MGFALLEMDHDLERLTHWYWAAAVSNNHFTQGKGVRAKGFFVNNSLMYVIEEQQHVQIQYILRITLKPYSVLTWKKKNA